MKRYLLLGLVLLCCRADADEPSPASYAAQGKLILAPFASAPFPHPSRAAGYTYQGKHYSAAEHYQDNTVALFIPRRFRAGSAVDFVVHFHGWRGRLAGVLEHYQLIEQLVASGRNAILIVPQGPTDAPDSGGGRLEDEGGFRRFMTEAMSVLQTNRIIATNAAPGTILLSGHSGGYRVMSAIVAQGGLEEHIKEVWLFDALYAQTPRFLHWAERTGGRLLDIFTETGGTKQRSEELMDTLQRQKLPFLLAPDTRVSTAQLRTNQFIFLTTDLGHNEVLAGHRTFQRFLESSSLAPAAGS
ncbi:MAG TPA: hypothetical protein PKN95_02840 [Verrucomicrobiota bacterium]|nr:hypothetical protein [Verrucomicrobiota bacterium]HNT13248.1 hypothetical protein [Verrucomicrobiota bacterium]